ncbi:FUN14 domain-containing protein [Methylomonas rivi]|uniref:FUN14 family protein n=1 Tax=Methylomonas rivi TaxID=2952226 RepID=A0ABT1U7U7_9GAMM|nr:FUN14 domain-containing protein [Methylomonas sp. WSC-6]MCQ8129716.1 hypothetical protein [Methylomonas sp. WSC-6]
MNDNTFTAPANDIFSSAFLLGNVGAPFIIGLAVGYFAKKMLKTALFVGGAMVTLLFVAESYGIISINGAALQDAASLSAQAARDSGSFLLDHLAVITSRGASGAGGFYVGFKLG